MLIFLNSCDIYCLFNVNLSKPLMVKTIHSIQHIFQTFHTSCIQNFHYTPVYIDGRLFYRLGRYFQLFNVNIIYVILFACWFPWNSPSFGKCFTQILILLNSTTVGGLTLTGGRTYRGDGCSKSCTLALILYCVYWEAGTY